MVNKSKCDRVETKPHVSRSDTVPSLEPALASVYCSTLYSTALLCMLCPVSKCALHSLCMVHSGLGLCIVQLCCILARVHNDDLHFM